MATTPESIFVIAGAEPLSHTGTNGCGVVVLHGFTGNPSSMRGVAEAFVAAGYSVEMPRLPGHGTTLADMMTTAWADWAGCASAVYRELASRVDKVVVVGLSMGGTLTAYLAAHNPEIAGIVTINGALEPMNPDFRAMVEGMVEAGGTEIPGIGSDIAKPGVVESAYPGTPLAALLSLADGGAELDTLVSGVKCPSLVMYSPQDHVVPVTASPYFASKVGGPVEVVTLDRSFHVATLDFDADLINERAVAFANRVCGL
jgi:carboxylesterase